MRILKKTLTIFNPIILLLWVLPFSVSAIAEENEESVYIPDRSIRMELINLIENEGGTVENQLPTVSQLENIESDLNIGGDTVRSLEGMQYLKKIKQLQAVQLIYVTDYRPLSGMTSLESINLYQASLPEGEIIKEKSLSFVEGMTNLRAFHAMTFHTFDLTPFNELDNLKTINLSGFSSEGYEFKTSTPLIVSATSRKASLKNPVQFSKQFEGAEIMMYPEDERGEWPGYTYENGVLSIENIDPAASQLAISISAVKEISDGMYHYHVRYYVPLTWVE